MSTRGERRAQLQDALRTELMNVLGTQGWRLDPARDYGPDSPDIAGFRREVAPDFAAALVFSRPFEWPASQDLTVTSVIGASYEPLYRLWPSLGERRPRVGEVTAHIGSDEHIEISSVGDARATAQRLAERSGGQAVALAELHASVDALVAANRGDPGRLDTEIRVVPALLAAAGRTEEARTVLAEYRNRDESVVTEREFRRFCYLLTRWLDSGADIPAEPAPYRYPEPSIEPPSFSQVQRDSRNTTAAVDAVMENGRGLGRTENRAMLRQELADRHITLSPLAIETTLDGIETRRQPFGTIRQYGRFFETLGGIGVDVFNMVRTGLPKPQPRLEPPDHALFPADLHSTERAQVALDADASRWLAHVHASARLRVAFSATVTVWLTWDPEPPDDQSRLAAHIGTQRVGTLADADRYRQLMLDAARLDEHPYVQGSLNARPDNAFLLEIDAPTSA